MYDLYPGEWAERQAPFNGGLGHASEYPVAYPTHSRPLSAQVAEQTEQRQSQGEDVGSVVLDQSVELGER